MQERTQEKQKLMLDNMHIPSQSDDAALVLLVDDSPETLTMFTDAFSLEGMQVIVAQSGREALTLASKMHPDIIIMDAMMPGMDGFEACQILKSESLLAEIPVIFMTGLNESEHVVRALAVGGVDFVVKPASLPELFARMQVHLANARKTRSARDALDTTGRRVVAVSAKGDISWVTPQASELLARAGMRVDAGAHMPWEIGGWLADLNGKPWTDDTDSLVIERNHLTLEFRLVGASPNGEWLLRVVDRDAGTDEDRLSTAFDLTFREAEVLLWITHGKSNKEIAEILRVSPRTVNKHLEQIFDKLGVENRTAAATMSVRILWD